MTLPTTRWLNPGSPVPDTEVRTDEGTPIALPDFEGRSVAVFLTGATLNRSALILIKGIHTRFREFIDAGCSPLVVSGVSIEALRELRETDQLPFVLLSDPELRLHAELAGDNRRTEGYDVWVIDEDGRISAVVHAMPPREQIAAALAALTRLSTATGVSTTD